MEPGRNTCIGSGGWVNIIEKFSKAKSYCDNPFEVRYHRRRKQIVPIKGEWIGDHLNKDGAGSKRAVDIRCQDVATAKIPPSSLDAVFTAEGDPFFTC